MRLYLIILVFLHQVELNLPWSFCCCYAGILEGSLAKPTQYKLHQLLLFFIVVCVAHQMLQMLYLNLQHMTLLNPAHF